MVSYETFKENVKEKFMDYLPEKYHDMKLRVISVNKVNDVMDGITLISSDGQDKYVSPTIYINDMYDHYLETKNLQEVLESAAHDMDRAFTEKPDLGNLDFDSAKDNIVFQLVNTMQNEDMLKDMPHREFQDLSIIYRWVVSADERGLQSAVVRNNLAGQLGMTEGQLFRSAVENTRRLMKPTVRSMNEVIRDMFMKDGMPPEIVDAMIGEMPQENTMWVITNERGINGAASILYEDKLHELAEQLGTDLYIIPSSIHECIALSTNMGDPNELAQMVADVNMSQVDLKDRLSNQVYHYDKNLRKISLATDTLNKRLDGIKEEPQFSYNAKAKTR